MTITETKSMIAHHDECLDMLSEQLLTLQGLIAFHLRTRRQLEREICEPDLPGLDTKPAAPAATTTIGGNHESD